MAARTGQRETFVAFAGNLTRGFRYTALEIRCAIRLQQQRPVRVLLATPWLDRVELLSHDNTTDMLAGELVPNHQRAVQSRNPAFPVLLRQGINIFTLRMDSPGSGMILPLELQDEAVFAPTDSRENWLLGGFFGFISSLAVISVVFGVFSRDPIFFVYALGLVANLALVFIQFGLPAILFGFAGPLLNTLTVVLTAVTVMFFCRVPPAVPAHHLRPGRPPAARGLCGRCGHWRDGCLCCVSPVGEDFSFFLSYRWTSYCYSISSCSCGAARYDSPYSISPVG